MHSTRVAPRLCKKAITSTLSPQFASPKRRLGMMTFPYLPQSIAADMAPLLRMIDRPIHPRARRWAQPRHIAAPRFDVRERNAAFELQGELPGLQQENVTIEFTDPHTLVIRGKVEREETFTNMKDDGGSAQLEGNQSSAKAISGGEGETASSADAASTEAQGNQSNTALNNADAGTDAVSSKTGEFEDGERYKYWVSERVVGGFERHFKFPSDVDQEAVKASLKNGILSVVVPKKISRGHKRIVVEGE